MSETTEAKRIPIPKTVTDREFWLDCFASFAQTAVQFMLEQDWRTGPEKLPALKDAIRACAELADTALDEALFRQSIVEDTKKKRKTPQRIAKKRTAPTRRK